MKNKIKKKLILGVLTISSLLIFVTPTIALGMQETFMYEDVQAQVEPRTDIKEWMYTVIDGDIYKRLYNYSTGRWETDWIFVAHGTVEN